MKKIALKNLLAILFSLALVCSLFFATLLSLPMKKTVKAVEGTITPSFEVEEGEEILAGDTFTLSVTVSSTFGSSYFWGAFVFSLQISDGNGNNINASYIESVEFLDFEGELADAKCDNDSVQEDLEEGEIVHSTIRIAARNGSLVDSLTMDKTCTVKAKITTAENIPGNTKINFKIEEHFKAETQVLYYSNDGNYEEHEINYSDNPEYFVINDNVTVNIREKSSDNTLSSVKVGTTSANEQTYSKTGDTPLATAISYDYTEATVLSTVNITPTANDAQHAIIYMAAGSTAPAETEANLAESGKPKTFTLTSEVRVVTILVKAETGDTKTYTVTIVDKYVALSSLVIDVGTKTEGVTKIGLPESVTFSPETLTYTVDVPSDYDQSETGVKITPTVAEGHGIQTAVALAGTNSSPASNSVASGAPVQVTGISNDGTLTLTATASDGTTTKVYTVTFKLWSVETGSLTVKVQGAEKQYESDAEKAAEKKIDYYFKLTDEAECKGKFLISNTLTEIPIKIATNSTDEGEAYDATKEYGAGTFYIILTAPAGNKKTYIASLSKMEFLELAADSTYQFIFEETVGTGPRAKGYLRTYHEKGMTHGIDDKDFEKVILGNISPKTTINAFLSNISPSQLNMIRIYNNKDQLLYDCGADIEGIDKANYDKWSKYRISTSWYIQYGGTAENPLETVYISVLGDTSCNGTIDSADSVKMSAHISKKKLIEVLEVRLAGYITNGGNIAAKDITKINRIITLKDTIESCLYKITPPEQTTGA